jgi:hypothetical protein
MLLAAPPVFDELELLSLQAAAPTAEQAVSRIKPKVDGFFMVLSLTPDLRNRARKKGAIRIVGKEVGEKHELHARYPSSEAEGA